MTRTTEDRVRAHYADRAARETLPGPKADARLRRAQQAGDTGTTRPVALGLRRRRVWLAVAAAAVVLAGVIGMVSGRDDRDARVSTYTPTSTTEPGGETVPPGPGPSLPESAPTGPIVALEGVLGSWSGSAWVPWSPGDTAPSGDEYQIVRLGDDITTASGSSSEVGPPCSVEREEGIDVGLQFPEAVLDPAPIAVTGVADPRPRPVEVLSTDDPVYREAAMEVMADLGVTDAQPTISQVVRSDLDGDGTAEVLVVAEDLSDPHGLMAGDGDYSVAFIRQVDGDDARSRVVDWSIVDDTADMRPFIEVYRVAAVADLNGDGRMEVVVNGRYYEGSSAVVYELQGDGALVEVLSVGCGA